MHSVSTGGIRARPPWSEPLIYMMNRMALIRDGVLDGVRF